jgi:L-asparaginase
MHVEYHTVCTKDSTEITDEDRAELARALSEDVATNRVVVTHGTDTMIETGNFLARDPRLADVVIVLTGSMRPQKFRDTDAAFNIGVAVGAVHVLSPGVFICMGGCVISHERCRRDMKSGAFVAVP